jgi:hypothetical protein
MARRANALTWTRHDRESQTSDGPWSAGTESCTRRVRRPGPVPRRTVLAGSDSRVVAEPNLVGRGGTLPGGDREEVVGALVDTPPDPVGIAGDGAEAHDAFRGQEYIAAGTEALRHPDAARLHRSVDQIAQVRHVARRGAPTRPAALRHRRWVRESRRRTRQQSALRTGPTRLPCQRAPRPSDRSVGRGRDQVRAAG